MPSSATVQRAARLGVATLLAIFLAACGGGGGDDAPPPAAPPPAGSVGPAGATIASADNNATLTVPAGALNSTINVTLTPATDGFQSDPQIVPGTVYKLGAPDTALTQPATLSLAIPDSVASGVAGNASHAQSQTASRAHALGVVDPNGLISCNPFVPPGADVPPGTVCIYDHAPCPASTPNETGTKIDDYFNRTVYLCQAPNQPKVQLVQLSASGPPTLLATDLLAGPKNIAQTQFNVLTSQTVGLLRDTTPPKVQFTSIVEQLGDNEGRLVLSAHATDNVGIDSVYFELWGNVTGLKVSNLAKFTRPPFVWTSPVMSLDDIYQLNLTPVTCSAGCDFNVFYAVVFDHAGNNSIDSTSAWAGGNGVRPPIIQNFFATPFTLPAGGGDVVLSWAVDDTQTLSIDNGVGDVTAVPEKTVHVTAPTTFHLTATNPQGSTSVQFSVAVAGGQPAPTISAFTATPANLPPGGGTVKLAWTTAGADTIAIDHGVGTFTSANAFTNINVTANSTFTLTATNASGAVTKQAAVVVAVNNDRFVDVSSGNDTNACSQAAPCKTIAKAMTGAPSGATVYLADGSYGSATQGASATVPDGVTLRAAHPGAATLANVALTAAGSATFSDIVLDAEGSACASINAGSTTGTPTLLMTGVLIKCGGALNVHGNVKATMIPGALAGGLYTAALPGTFNALLSVTDSAELLIQGGILDGNNAGSPGFGAGFLAVTGNGKLTLDGSTLRNRTSVGILTGNNGAIVLKNNALIDHVGAADTCAAAAAIVLNGTGSLTMDHSQIAKSASAGICVRSGAGASTIALTQSTITSSAGGIASETGAGSTATITADGVSLTNNTTGIIWTGAPGTSIDLKNSSVTGNVTGIQVDGTSVALKLRTSNVSGNSDSGVAIFNNVAADLGTQADPGLNTFAGNGSQGIKDNLVGGQTTQAVGNTWNVNQQGADAAGHYSTAPAYTPVPKTGPANGANFEIANASTVNL
ncbi:MAG: DUF1565 domain-containing protein [Caldimonas sp.]